MAVRVVHPGFAALMLSVGVGTRAAPAQTHHLRPERARRPTEVIVRPGDRLSLTAGGCFPIPNQPSRSLLQANGNLDQGLIFIPGVTMAFVPIAGLVGRDLVVPRELAYPGPANIWLDWGRPYASDLEAREVPPSTPLPCEGLENQPYLDIRITRDSEPGPSANGSLTLELARYDRNLLPLNPSWAGGAKPDVCAACDGFRLERRPDRTFWLPAVRQEQCSRQRPYIDSGGCGPSHGDCARPGRRLAGHVNWGPATFTGFLSTTHGGPVHLALDGDINLFLEPDGGAGLLAQKPKSRYNGVIELEFASAETTRWFRTPWWRSFPFRASSYRAVGALFAGPRQHSNVNGNYPSLQRKPATVIGIFGIDTEHGAHPELHPVLALAIQTETHLDRDVWQVFARNWGTGGDCSSRLNQGMDSRRVLLMLPGAGDRSYRSADGVFLDHGVGVSDWKVYAGGSATTLVVELPHRACSVVEGQLTLQRGIAAAGEQAHFSGAEAPVGEPMRPEFGPEESESCTKAPWFVPLP